MAMNKIRDLLKDLDTLAVNGLYNGPAQATEAVIRDLQDLGPAWTGRFSNSWRITTPTGAVSGGGGQAGAAQPVGAPLLSGKDFAKVVSSGSKAFKVDNTAPYADIACDLREGDFENPGTKAIKEVSYGYRDKAIRGEPWPIPGNPGTKGPNRSTAPLDWFSTYVDGGKLDKRVKDAMDKAFKGFKS